MQNLLKTQNLLFTKNEINKSPLLVSFIKICIITTYLLKITLTKNKQMKHLTTLILCLTFISILHGQSLEEKIAQEACQYLESLETIEEIDDSIRGSIVAAMVTMLPETTDEDRMKMITVEGIQGILKESKDLIPTYCYNVRRLLIEYKKNQFYTISKNKEATNYFREGNKLMQNGDYKKAIKKFKSAIKLDEKFVYAIDHLAICHRHLKEYKKALKYYKQSLDIFPEGDVALLNIAVVYSLLNDVENAVKNYEALAFLYPDNPEGYFGLARTLFIQEDYENSLDNLFIAHRIYTETESDYIADSEKLLAFIIKELKKLERMDLVYKMAKKHDIVIE